MRLCSQAGIYYARNRWYSPEVGAFISPDPLRSFGEFNPYQYTMGNPINWVDPLGLRTVIIMIIISEPGSAAGMFDLCAKTLKRQRFPDAEIYHASTEQRFANIINHGPPIDAFIYIGHSWKDALYLSQGDGGNFTRAHLSMLRRGRIKGMIYFYSCSTAGGGEPGVIENMSIARGFSEYFGVKVLALAGKSGLSFSGTEDGIAGQGFEVNGQAVPSTQVPEDYQGQVWMVPGNDNGVWTVFDNYSFWIDW